MLPNFEKAFVDSRARRQLFAVVFILQHHRTVHLARARHRAVCAHLLQRPVVQNHVRRAARCGQGL